MASVNARISAETDVDEPKALSVEVQPAPNGSVGDSDSDLLSADARPAAERRLVRQLDLRLMPTIIIIFIMNYIDVSIPLYAIRCAGLTRFSVTTAQCCLFGAPTRSHARPASIPDSILDGSGGPVCVIRSCANSFQHGEKLLTCWRISCRSRDTRS